MDTGKGFLEQVDANNDKDLQAKMAALENQFPQHGGWFQEGEIVELKGSKFRIGLVTPKKIILRVLPRD